MTKQLNVGTNCFKSKFITGIYCMLGCVPDLWVQLP